MVHCLNALGVLSLDTAKKREYFKQSYQLARNLSDLALLGICAANLGQSYSYMAEFEHAKPLLEDALDISKRLRHSVSQAIRLAALGKVAIELGNYELAIQLYEEALDLELKSGRTGRLRKLLLVGAYQRIGNYALAHQWLDDAAQNETTTRGKFRQGNLHAELLLAEEKYDDAEQILTASREMGQKLDTIDEDRMQLHHLCMSAEVYIHTQRYAEVLTVLSDFAQYPIFRDYHIYAGVLYGIALTMLDRIDEAVTVLQQSIQACDHLLEKSPGYVSPKYFRALALALLSVISTDTEKRERFYHQAVAAHTPALLNRKAKEYIDQNLRLMSVIHPLDTDGYIQHFRRLLTDNSCT